MPTLKNSPALPPLSILVAVFLRVTFVGFGLGLLLALVAVPSLRDYSLSNQLAVELRTRSLLWMTGCCALGWLATGAPLLFKRSRSRLELVEQWSRALLPLGWLWPAPLFLDWEVFNGAGLERVIIAGIWVLGLEQALSHSFELLPRLTKPLTAQISGMLPRISLRAKLRKAHVVRLVSAAATLCLIVWFGAFCSRYSVMQHHRLGTSGFDLGIFDNLFFNLLHGEWFKGGVDIDNRGGTHLQFHANFLAYLFLPFYAMSPRAETLLIVQAWVVAFSAIPIFLLANYRLKSSLAAFVVACCYLLHEAVQGPVFYEFHFLTLSPFFVAWTVYFFDRGLKWPLLLSWLCTLLLREDQGAILGTAALVYLLKGHRPKTALVAGICGVGWLAFMRFYFMPSQASGAFQQHIGIFQAMVAPGDHGFGGVVKTMLTNPVFTLENVLEARKLEYVLILAAPFGFLPFRKPLLLLLFIPAAVFTLGTSNYPPPVSKGFQYTMYWMPLLAIATILRLGFWRAEGKLHRCRAALSSAFVISCAMSVSAGALFQQNSFTGGFRRIVFEMTDAERERLEELRGLIAKIPPRASLVASESLVPHVSNRPEARTVRQGIPDVEYLLLSVNETRGGEQAERLLRDLGTWPDQRFGMIEKTQRFQLWKRGAPTAQNISALHLMGHYLQLRDDGTPRKKRTRGKSTKTRGRSKAAE